MTEAVRLVVWDLDETYWRGTVTEGGITEYLQAHHDIVIELARRGIISSICSKNDWATIEPILIAHGIRDYFVFPSVSWEPKGPRLAALVDAVQLRAPTVMFIDDNPMNRAEAAGTVPGLQVEDEHFIPRMLDDPRFKGKADSALSRLKQYQLLERRKQDEVASSHDASAFLRGCDIRVRIEYDIEKHIDRAIELINRTNQLNYTKRRLPEDSEAARQALRNEISLAGRQAGLVHVVDRYGDYGFVGFFLTANGRKDLGSDGATQKLKHFCFSCRTLGMFVELWLYNWLRRPALTVEGEVLTDLADPREVDWIRLVNSFDETDSTADHIAPAFRVHGGCEANAVGHFLGRFAPNVHVTGNFQAGRFMVRVNSVPLALAARHYDSDFLADAAAIGLPGDLLAQDFFAAPLGAVYVFSGALDAGSSTFLRHRSRNWLLKIALRFHGQEISPLAEPADQVEAAIAAAKPSMQADLRRAITHLRQNYRAEPYLAPRELRLAILNFVAAVPEGGRLVFLLDADRVRSKTGALRTAKAVASYNALVQDVCATVPFAAVIGFGDHIQHDEEILTGGNHYDRMVYCRTAESIAAIASELAPKGPRHQQALAKRIERLEGWIAQSGSRPFQRAGKKQGGSGGSDTPVSAAPTGSRGRAAE